MKKLKYIWLVPGVILCILCIRGAFLQVEFIKHVIESLPNIQWGVIQHSGVDEYVRSKGNHCQIGASGFLYTYKFVEKFDYLDGDYDYFATTWTTLDGYELAIMHLTYTPDIYTLAKADIFENTTFVSDGPVYIYNGYDFYRLEWDMNTSNKFTMNAFNDEKNTIVMIGFCGRSTETGLIGTLPDQAGWSEYLKTYFGEYYNFDE